MQTIYQPGLASQNCYFVPGVAIAAALVLGLVAVLLVFRYVPRHSPHFRLLVVLLLAVPLMIVVVMAQHVISGAESIVRIAMDGSHLEYRYCSRLALQVERHPISSLTGSAYRRDVEHRRNGGQRIRHYLDLQFWGRPDPITVDQNAYAQEVDLTLAERIAPDAVREFRAATGK